MPLHLNGRWFLQIVDRDSGNLYPIYPLFPCSDIFISNVGWGGGGVMFFWHFMIFPTFLDKIILGIFFFFLENNSNILFHLMFYSCFLMLDLFPTFLEFFWKY